jgi:hypothetical protein
MWFTIMGNSLDCKKMRWEARNKGGVRPQRNRGGQTWVLMMDKEATKWGGARTLTQLTCGETAELHGDIRPKRPELALSKSTPYFCSESFLSFHLSLGSSTFYRVRLSLDPQEYAALLPRRNLWQCRWQLWHRWPQTMGVSEPRKPHACRALALT